MLINLLQEMKIVFRALATESGIFFKTTFKTTSWYPDGSGLKYMV